MFIPGYNNTSHERNENSSPPSTMLPHQQQHQQPGNQQHSPVNNNMPYNNMHMNSAMHKNMTTAAPSGGYHIPNMKEEPNIVQNNYSNLVNGTNGAEDLAVS